MEFLEIVYCAIKRLLLLAEGKANLVRAAAGKTIEARPRNRRNADLFHQTSGECTVVFKREFGDVGHDVVSAAGLEGLES